MAFGFYASWKGIPKDMREIACVCDRASGFGAAESRLLTLAFAS